MKNIPLLLATIGGSLLLILGVTFLFAQSAAEPELADASQLTQGARPYMKATGKTAAPTPEVTGSVTPDPAATESATPEPQPLITVVEFSDFQCPACKAAAPLKDQILAQYPGQVEFIFRHFPLVSIHPNALPAAQAAETVGRFDKFWEFHDILFDQQSEWSDLSQDQAREKFAEYAEMVGVKKEDFANALKDDIVTSSVQADINLANTLNVNATPTFFVNGKKVSAPELLSTIEDLIN